MREGGLIETLYSEGGLVETLYSEGGREGRSRLFTVREGGLVETLLQ